jgi:protein O-GlcNAc transferase
VRGACDAFEDVRFVDDASIAELSRKRGVDIAFDLMGHTERARTGIFVQRAAPLQVQWLGYPGTMGTTAMDGLLADAIVVPDAERAHYTERVIAMPVTYQPNGKPVALPRPGRPALGLPEDAIVLAAFNDRLKIAPEAFHAWMRILAQSPNAVLWLVETGERATENLRAEARKAGIAPERLVFAKRVPLDEHRRRLPAADLALDTVPYGGHATTSDLLAAGVPVIAVLGNTFACRVPASLLHAAGLPELVTTSLGDYEALAVALAKDPRRLADLRKKVEAARESSTLFDADRFTRDFERACAALMA